ncbi:MAG: DUF3106 domain-containing protein [Alcanivoracaceae bacterium]|nr:DUF3106 domain-containing protein [Alcanivoracaceae bacterium]
MRIILFSLFITFSNAIYAQYDWQDLDHKQQNLLLPFQSQWPTLDLQAREKLVINTNKWLTMTPFEKKQSRQKLNRFKQLPIEEQQRIKDRTEKFKKLSVAEQRQLINARKQFQQLSPEQKRRVKNKYNQLKPQQKRKKLRQHMRKKQGMRFVNEFDIEKRQPLIKMFRNLSDGNRSKLRRYLMNLLPKPRHALVLELLEMSDIDRRYYIETVL